MKKLLDSFGNSPVIEEVTALPTTGKYHAIINGCETREICPLDEEYETCLVVHYKLIKPDTLDVYDFIETYFPYKGNARTDDFLAFLQQNGYDFLSNDEIVGIKATVDVTYEFLGGYVHPIISFRRNQ